MKKIVFTGGGTAGHVTPNLALIAKFRQEGWQIDYIGSKNSIEQKLITQEQINFHSIASGKLRRYFSWQNFIDPFKIMFGFLQAFLLLIKLRPNVIFSKGGFVSFPVVLAAKFCRIPVIIHESDYTPGLANKLSFPCADKICVSFPDTKKFIKAQDKVVISGSPIRPQFFTGSAAKGRELCQFANDKKMILVIGGGSGAEIINKTLVLALPELLKNHYVCHVCGIGKTAKEVQYPGYIQFEYVTDELFDIMAAADIVVSRSGANSLFELVALKKLHLLIPLALNASRGDQIINAEYFAKKHISKILLQENLTTESLITAVAELERDAEQYRAAREQYAYHDGLEILYNLIKQMASS